MNDTTGVQVVQSGDQLAGDVPNRFLRQILIVFKDLKQFSLLGWRLEVS